MSKVFRYNNGFKGFVNDKVAAILEGRGDGKIIGDAKKPEPVAAPDEKKAGK